MEREIVLRNFYTVDTNSHFIGILQHIQRMSVSLKDKTARGQ